MANWSSVLLYLFAAMAASLYVAVKWNYNYWKRKKISGPTPTFLLGHVGKLLQQKENLGEVFMNIYSQTKNLPYTGIYMLFRRTWVVNDLDMIQAILVKDFNYFTNHGLKFNKKTEPLSCHLFNLEGEKWKKLRNKLTPTFTSSKMRSMFGTVAKCGEEMEVYLDGVDTHALDIKDTIAKFTTDIIGSCAFGLECNSFKYSDTEFRRMGRKIFELGTVRSFIQFLTFFIPALVDKIWFSILGDGPNSFFINTVEKTIKYREENNIVRNDFMQLLIRLKNDGYVEDEDSGRSIPVLEKLQLISVNWELVWDSLASISL